MLGFVYVLLSEWFKSKCIVEKGKQALEMYRCAPSVSNSCPHGGCLQSDIGCADSQNACAKFKKKVFKLKDKYISNWFLIQLKMCNLMNLVSIVI